LENITSKVTAITVPTLVIAGGVDRVDSVDLLKAELLSRVPHAVLHVLPGTGHLSMLESPRELAQIIAEFANALRSGRRFGENRGRIGAPANGRAPR
jgi:pimeloyl-ACP methyl ester carboxylesterase